MKVIGAQIYLHKAFNVVKCDLKKENVLNWLSRSAYKLIAKFSIKFKA